MGAGSLSRRIGLVVALCLGAGCSADTGNEAAEAPVEAEKVAVGNAPDAAEKGSMIGLGLTADGLHLYDRQSDSTRVLRFGMKQSEVMAALAFEGVADRGLLEECGAGPLDVASWPNGLAVYFQDGKWLGWASGPRPDGNKKLAAAMTTEGMGPGSYREELEREYGPIKVAESTLGAEFEAGGMFGIFDSDLPGAMVTNMWAGVSCNMR